MSMLLLLLLVFVPTWQALNWTRLVNGAARAASVLEEGPKSQLVQDFVAPLSQVRDELETMIDFVIVTVTALSLLLATLVVYLIIEVRGLRDSLAAVARTLADRSKVRECQSM